MADEPRPSDDVTPEDGAEEVAEQPTAEEEIEVRVAPEVPEVLDELDEAGLRDLHERLGTWRTERREERDVDGVRVAIEGQQRIVDEITRRRADARRVESELAELDLIEVPVLPEAEPSLAGAGATAAQLAAARGAQPANEQVPPAPAHERMPVALLAGAGTEIATAGSAMSYAQLGQAIDRVKTRPEGQTILASLPSFEEDADRLGLPPILSERNGVTLNDELIQEAVADWHAREFGEPAPSRQGAICQPFDIIRDIPDAFVTDTPVSDIFPSRPAGRGGFQFTVSGTLADVGGAVNYWDETKQAAVDVTNSATWKPCIDYVCPTPQSAVLEAIATCVRYPITLEMSNPERVQNLNNAVGALEARMYEARMLQRIDQNARGYVFNTEYGALPGLIEAVNTVIAQMTYTNRQALGNYVMLIPPGVTAVLLMDRANRAYVDNDERDDVMAYLQANLYGVRRIVETKDASAASEPGIPYLPVVPPVGNQGAAMGSAPFISGSVYRIRLVDPAAAIYAETGEMNAGVLRDSNLIRQNMTAYFREWFFFLAKHGPQPWATLDMQLCADGSRAGFVTPVGCIRS